MVSAASVAIMPLRHHSICAACLQAVVPYLSATVSKDKAEKVALDVLSHFFKEMQEKTRVVEEEEEGEDLCDCEFSLAYGAL